MKPFRFGVNLRTVRSRGGLADTARKIEALGYSVLTAPDHLGELIAPIPALATAAAATTKLRLGTLVLNNDFRHPVLVAREAAALDLLSDGRLELGLGAGHMRSEYVLHGVRARPRRVRAGGGAAGGAVAVSPHPALSPEG